MVFLYLYSQSFIFIKLPAHFYFFFVFKNYLCQKWFLAKITLNSQTLIHSTAGVLHLFQDKFVTYQNTWFSAVTGFSKLTYMVLDMIKDDISSIKDVGFSLYQEWTWMHFPFFVFVLTYFFSYYYIFLRFKYCSVPMKQFTRKH